MNITAYTRQEIISQPQAWRQALEIVESQAAALRGLDVHSFSALVFTGCGSTYYLAEAAASLTQALTGLPARGVPASECLFYPDSVYPSRQRVLLVAISRSGSTTETLRVVEQFQTAKRGEVVTISCYPDQPLARMGAARLVLTEAQEKSVAQTRSFASMYLAASAMAALWAERDELRRSMGRLPDLGARLIGESSELARRVGSDLQLERFFFLGSGPRYGLASELSLKMKEMSLSQSEPFRFLEFRHGPMSMVNDQTLLVGLLSSSARQAEQAVMEEMKGRGARLLSLAEEGADINFASGLDEAARNVLFLPVMQLVAMERSLAKGLDPDRPKNLEYVVKADV